MGVRLRGFDYTQPYFYMVTVKRADGFPEFARVVGDAACHYLEANGTTRLFVDTLTGAGEGSEGKSGAVDRSVGQHLFEFDWHDWIVKRDGQLAAFTRYIRENAERSWLRKSHREYFQCVSEIDFLGRKWC